MGALIRRSKTIPLILRVVSLPGKSHEISVSNRYPTEYPRRRLRRLISCDLRVKIVTLFRFVFVNNSANVRINTVIGLVSGPFFEISESIFVIVVDRLASVTIVAEYYVLHTRTPPFISPQYVLKGRQCAASARCCSVVVASFS